MKVMIVVTHLLGTGHLARALTLARAFKKAGHAVWVVSGGMPAAHLNYSQITFMQLPPLRSDGVNFTKLIDAENRIASAQYLKARQDSLLANVLEVQPDVIITELFPFGRRVLRDEFVAMLTEARERPIRPLVCASIRDILAPPSKPAKALATEDMVETFYDAVLVHSDRQITPLKASWPVTSKLEPYLHYTGFVAAEAPRDHPTEAGTGEILVSAGGGDVGAELFRQVVNAAAARPEWHWRILVGGQRAQELVHQLHSEATSNVIVEPARADFRQMLRHAEASVSMCGYNTALDILQAGTPAVFIPFDAGGEVEQTLRAEALALLPGIALLRSSDVTPTSLLKSLDLVRSSPRRSVQATNFEGAGHSVRIIEALAERIK
ncbi:glycosyltransferase family protein [Roseobacter sp. EG26]|uniref:glycosyltransferase family protein n=1 Tax=Roseobacter sp. EG26 TaxID=3412477 RepID=UPI003CE539DF